MRGTVGTLTVVVILSLMAPFASSQEIPPQTENVFHTYSGAVQRAFFQIEAVENSILEDPPEQWLVLTTLAPEIIQPWIDENVEIKPSVIQPTKEIKSLGKFKVTVSLHSEVHFPIFINVLPEEEKA